MGDNRRTMCRQSTQTLVDMSLHEEAFKEAERHKWIESQKHGRDLGDHAFHEWYFLHWGRFCRVKRLEHLKGQQRWREFEHHNYGQLASLTLQGDLLVDRILDRFDDGQENLDIIKWAHDWALPIPRVIDVLVQLDMNRARLDYDGIR
jgi:hypothetical protein